MRLTAQLVHEDMPGQIRSITAAFLAAGIDPEKHIVFNQSRRARSMPNSPGSSTASPASAG